MNKHAVNPARGRGQASIAAAWIGRAAVAGALGLATWPVGAMDGAMVVLLRGALDTAAGVAQQSGRTATPRPLAQATPMSAPMGAGATTATAPVRCPKSRAQPLPPIGPRPDGYAPAVLWPAEPACDIHDFPDLKFNAARAQRDAFVNASKVRCGDCEGGYAYDAWARHALTQGGDEKQYLALLVGLAVGQSLSWKGGRYQGTVQATGEHPIGPFPCRQYHWTLKDGARVVAEREGLLCQYKRPYAASARWNEVI